MFSESIQTSCLGESSFIVWISAGWSKYMLIVIYLAKQLTLHFHQAPKMLLILSTTDYVLFEVKMWNGNA